MIRFQGNNKLKIYVESAKQDFILLTVWVGEIGIFISNFNCIFHIVGGGIYQVLFQARVHTLYILK